MLDFASSAFSLNIFRQGEKSDGAERFDQTVLRQSLILKLGCHDYTCLNQDIVGENTAILQLLTVINIMTFREIENFKKYS